MKKLCFITAARSEYGLLKWLMKDIEVTDGLELKLIVTGGHLLKEQGYTVDQIKQDGFAVDSEIDVHLDSGSPGSIAASMGRMAEGMADTFERIRPDYLVVLGDRYELLPICSTAFVMNIPIIHLYGGDVTEGAIDDGIRNAVTMMASYHFAGTSDSMDNIVRMRNSTDNIWTVGEMSIEAIRREGTIGRQELADIFDLDCDRKWVLMTVHPETRIPVEDSIRIVENCFEALDKFDDIQVIATYANADYGGDEINRMLRKKAEGNSSKYIVCPSMGSSRYYSMLRQAEFMIGNSSSGIAEAPALRCPAINIGNRQKGRHLCKCVFQSSGRVDDLLQIMSRLRTEEIDYSDADYWGDGYTSEKILRILKEHLGV